MKKLILAALAASIAVTPAVAAPNYQGNNHRTEARHGGRDQHRTVVVRKVVKQQHRVQYRKWSKGQRFDRGHAQNYRVVGNYRANHRLYAPPRGYQWVQSGNDAVLVALASGLIGAVIGGAF